MMLLMHQVAGVAVRPNWSLLLPLVAVRAGLGRLRARRWARACSRASAGLLFAVVLGPMMLFGCAYYPYAALAVLGPFQYVFLLNPLVFMSEAMRARRHARGAAHAGAADARRAWPASGRCSCSRARATFERRTIL